jgi:hypothetical protein
MLDPPRGTRAAPTVETVEREADSFESFFSELTQFQQEVG